LHSEDTPERGEYVGSGDGHNASKDESYDLENSSNVDDEPLAFMDVSNLVEETKEHFDMNEECFVAQELAVGVFGVGVTFQSTQFGICDVLEVREEPIEAVTSFSKAILVLISMVLSSYGVTTSTESTMLSSARALVDHRMTLEHDGLYYDLVEVKYCQVGEEGNYT